MCAPFVYYAISLWSPSEPERSRIRYAYLGYVVCALGTGLFQVHYYVDGPQIFMVFPVFLFPCAIAAGHALIMTVGARSATLPILGIATLALGLAQVLTVWDSMGTFVSVITGAYVLLVPIVSIYRRREWWPQSEAT